MKAPNGKETNLTEQQWLAVRSPKFIRTFGNWGELKPCPFCGGKAEILEIGRTDREKQVVKVYCTNAACICSQRNIGFLGQEEAVKAWNTRSSVLSRLRKVVKAWLKKKLKD